ncbi:MAG: polysaccharide biosynthesis C-terminal domain-containing protein [Halioglobus sp.]|nr:polysaccharide biosynthesis C-terminal domain-containing protein [Halioglobus sp.]
MPRLSQLLRRRGEAKNTYAFDKSVGAARLRCSGAAGLGLIGYPLITLIFGDAFKEAYVPLLVLLPGIVMASGARVLANDIAARGRPELNMYTSVVVVTVNVLGNMLLIPLYGLAGAAIATSIAYALNFMMRLAVHHYSPGHRFLVVLSPSDGILSN